MFTQAIPQLAWHVTGCGNMGAVTTQQYTITVYYTLHIYSPKQEDSNNI